MRLITIGDREYRTEDDRYRVKWHDGGPDVRSWYSVVEVATQRTEKARNVKGVRALLRKLYIDSLTNGTAPNIGDTLYMVLEQVNEWQLQAKQVRQVRVNGFLLEDAFGKTFKWELLDTLYHRTPQAAITAFIANKRKNIDTRDAANIEDARAIEWAKEHAY